MDEIFLVPEDEALFEPEECGCKEEMEEQGFEYTWDFYWDGVSWRCEHCGEPQF